MNSDEKKKIIDMYGPVDDVPSQIIKVVGVGGGGCNAVKNMYEEGIANVSFAVCNTDRQVLSHSPIPTKILLGDSGLGAGGNPELGKDEALKTKDAVKNLFDDDTKMCFITAGMGGGTGTGAAPIIASIARSMGILTIGIVTIPFYFEKKRKIIKALKGVEEMRKNVDSLLIINNESICDIYSTTQIPVKEAFKSADQILCNAAKSISELITLEGNINLDFRDVETTMHGGGGAIMAIGRARGERRVEKAIVNALESPLLYGSDITQAKNILFNIYTSDDAPLFVSEMREIDAFMYGLNPNIEVIWGTSDDNTLGKDAKIIILATGLDNRFMPKDTVSSANEDEQYGEVIAKLYREPVVGMHEPWHQHVADNANDNALKDSEPQEGDVNEQEGDVEEQYGDAVEQGTDVAEQENGVEEQEVGVSGTQTGDEEHAEDAELTEEIPVGSTEVPVEDGTDGEAKPNDGTDGGDGKHAPTFLERLKKHLEDSLGDLMTDD